MTIEEKIFVKTKINFNKILEYGFKKNKNLYEYKKNIMNDTFRVDIKINDTGIVKGKIYDLITKDEYTNFRIENNTGLFKNQVLDEYKKILEDIKNKCFEEENFIYDQSNRIAKLIKEKYGDEPNFEWDKFPFYGVFKNNNKWYSIIMNIDKSKIEQNFNGEIEIINIKLEPLKIEKLLTKKGFYPAYHMNKKNWITIILDNTISDNDIMNLIDESYSYTIIKKNI